MKATLEEATATTQEEGASTTSSRMEDTTVHGRALQDPTSESSPRLASPVASLGTSPSSALTRRLQLRLPKHRPQEEDLLSLLLSNLRAVGGLPT
jgi:hypothetical protein